MPTAIVTGASQGFGLELTRALCADGWTVVGDARHGDELVAALAGWPTAVACPGDVTRAEHRAELVAATRAAASTAATPGGSLELLVHNASWLGPSPLPRLADWPVEELAELFAVNVVAPLALTQDCLALLEAGRAPAVVALSSDAAVAAYPGWGGYGASKAALDQLMAVLGVEMPQLRVYAFDPGDLRTAMHQAAFPGQDISDRPLPVSAVPRLRALLDGRPASGRYRGAAPVVSP